jgi:predicted aspartyl protease
LISEIRSEPVRVLVDTGSELSWLPAEVLANTGIQPRRKRSLKLADGRTMDRDVGFCILESEGFITNDEIVFALPGDMHLLGVRTLEGFGVMVDSLAHRLVATITLAAPNTPLLEAWHPNWTPHGQVCRIRSA